MAREQKFIEVISANLANAEDHAHARRRPVSAPDRGRERRRLRRRHRPTRDGDAGPAALVYDPGHPDANADGYVEYPNVDVTTELVDLMIARRVHEANATVFQAAKSDAERALDI